MLPLNKNAIDDYLAPLNMNGLQGRMLRLPVPANKKREILFIYGHHSTIERWWDLAQELNQFGAVTVPDLPGFGGMQSLYRIGERPTLDGLADYLAAFVKLRYKRRRLTIVGVSFGFVVTTRMLQRYPDIAKKVDMVVSVAGFAHHDDFRLKKSRQLAYRVGTRVFSWRLPAGIFRLVCLQPFVLRQVYAHTPNIMDTEIKLWRKNDVRTYMLAANAMLRADNCQTQVGLPVWHVSARADNYLDNQLVEQHFKVIFSDFHLATTKLNMYDLQPIKDNKPQAHLLPSKLRRVLGRS